MDISIEATTLADAVVITPAIHGDERGYFKETYVKSKYRALGLSEDFTQDSVSISARNVLRGLHSDPKMSKLVQVLKGQVFDVIVDARRESHTFAKWQGFYLSDENHSQLYVPAGFLHGFLALSEDVIFCYKQGAEYSPAREVGIRYDDPVLDIAWPIHEAPRVSPKDLQNRSFAEVFQGA